MHDVLRLEHRPPHPIYPHASLIIEGTAGASLGIAFAGTQTGDVGRSDILVGEYQGSDGAGAGGQAWLFSYGSL